MAFTELWSGGGHEHEAPKSQKPPMSPSVPALGPLIFLVV